MNTDITFGELQESFLSTFLTFDLCGETFGVEVHHVREILDEQHITRLPNSPSELLGVVDVRGICVPIVDLTARLGMFPISAGRDARFVVFESGAERAPLGIVADRVRKVDVIPDDDIEAAPSTGVSNWDARFLRGFWRSGEDLVVLLDLEQVFALESADWVSA